jgi:inorganic pyrophosphatase
MHPHDDAKIILVADPFSSNTFFYEFETCDIGFVESLPSIVTLDGQTLLMARVWIRKGALAIRSTPFLVAATND